MQAVTLLVIGAVAGSLGEIVIGIAKNTYHNRKKKRGELALIAYNKASSTQKALEDINKRLIEIERIVGNEYE
jgi:hypothetical protein